MTVRTLVTGVRLNAAALSMTVGSTYSLAATVLPSNASIKNVLWYTSNSAVVSVNAYGQIRANGRGKATITVKTNDGGYRATCVVTVT